MNNGWMNRWMDDEISLKKNKKNNDSNPRRACIRKSHWTDEEHLQKKPWDGWDGQRDGTYTREQNRLAVPAVAVTGAVYEFKALHDGVMMALNEPGR